MRKIAGVIILVVFATWQSAVASDYEAGFSLGVREDQLKWNIAGDVTGNNPNILSELSWTDIRAMVIGVQFEGYSKSNWYFSGYYNYGIIYSGSNQDSDYFSDNRQDEFSRSNNNSDGGNTQDISFAIGYRLGQGEARDRNGLSIVPMVGYSNHIQDLTMTDGYQTINTISNVTGPFSGLDSSYKAEWQGVWAGLNLQYEQGQDLKFLIGYEYHVVNFSGEANWNLRTDFQHPVSFTHDADGTGQVLRLLARYRPSKTWAIDIEARIEDWKTDPGIDRVFFASGVVADTRLNEVLWESRSIIFRPMMFF